MEKLVTTASIKDAESCRSFVVFDTETTGLYPWRDKVIEIGAVRFRDGEPVETFHSMIDPEMHIVHGKMNLPSCGKEFFLLPVSRFFSVQ